MASNLSYVRVRAEWGAARSGGGTAVRGTLVAVGGYIPKAQTSLICAVGLGRTTPEGTGLRGLSSAHSRCISNHGLVQ